MGAAGLFAVNIWGRRWSHCTRCTRLPNTFAHETHSHYPKMTNAPHILFHLTGLSEDRLAEVTAMLMAEGCEGIVETAEGADAFVPADSEAVPTISTLLTDLQVPHTQETIAPANWNAEWEASYAPVRVGDALLIRAPFHLDAGDAQVMIELEPKMSFGTGHHETTRLVCQLLLGTAVEGLDVIDMGCGTGVLGILALKLGARNVIGIDVDEWAIENTRENVLRNHVAPFEAILGDVRKMAQLQCHVLLANINRNILLADMLAYAAAVLPGGMLLVSGFYVEDAPAVLAAAESAGFHHVEQLTENRWAALRFARQNLSE